MNYKCLTVLTTSLKSDGKTTVMFAMLRKALKANKKVLFITNKKDYNLYSIVKNSPFFSEVESLKYINVIYCENVDTIHNLINNDSLSGEYEEIFIDDIDNFLLMKDNELRSNVHRLLTKRARKINEIVRNIKSNNNTEKVILSFTLYPESNDDLRLESLLKEYKDYLSNDYFMYCSADKTNEKVHVAEIINNFLNEVSYKDLKKYL